MCVCVCVCVCLSLSLSLSPLFPTAHQKQNACGKSSATRNCLLPVHPTFTKNFSSYPNDSIELDSPSTSLLLLCFNFEVELQGCDSIYWVREGDFRMKTKTGFSSKAGLVLLSERATDCCENQRAPKSIQQLAFLVSGFPRIWARNWEAEQQSRRTYSISIGLRGNFAENFWSREGKRRKEETRETREKANRHSHAAGAWWAHG